MIFEIGSVGLCTQNISGVELIVVLGHTHCGAVHSTLHNEGHSYINAITNKVAEAIGDEKDQRKCEVLKCKT